MAKPTNSSPATYLQAGLEAQRAGRLEVAHRAYLEAARLLLEQARQTPIEHLRDQQVKQADQIIARAREIEAILAKPGRREPGRSTAPGEPQPVHESEPMPAWLLAERPRQRLADVAGLDDVKQQIHVKIIYPFTHPQAAERFGIQPGGGILLYGPPGTGKTYIARAVAGELDAAIFVARASNLMSQWFGKAEQNIAALFAAARREARAVIFLDEVEALIPARSASNSSVMPRVISEFLTQTQSLGTEAGGAVLLLGATNEPWAIDPAALRPGRFDEQIYVGLPDGTARLRLLELNLQQRPLAADVELATLADQLEGYSGADIAYVCTKASERAFLDAVATGLEREILWDDLLAAASERKPSVTAEQLRKYIQFRERHRG